MTEKFDVRMQLESYELIYLDSQVRRNLKAAIEKELPYKCSKIAISRKSGRPR